ncbi:MAG TPA: AIM24 family protein [Blastocatellia bacterium]|nr:AIM24 family protein [Blastocatellia bacterium]
MSQQRTHKCPWCGHISDGSQMSCPACGATIDVKEIVTDSGWAELPGRKDMAKLQIGNSSCQIEGNYVPVADFNLAPADNVYFAHHVLLWKDTQVNVSAMSLKGAWKRLLAGMPLIMTQAQGPGHIAFSRDAPGEMIALPLQPGQAVDVREHLFLVATGNVTYDWFQTGIWFKTRNGDETETHYPVGAFMDRFFAPQTPGLLLLHAAGNSFVRYLQPGQTILVKPTCLLFKDPTVQMQLHFEHPAGGVTSFWSSWSTRYLWLRLFGPGRVAVSSAYDHMHDNGRNIYSDSGATRWQW